jgi:hypothetical protein
MRLLKPGKS